MRAEWIIITQDPNGKFFTPQHSDGSLQSFATKHEAIEAGSKLLSLSAYPHVFYTICPQAHHRARTSK